MTSVMDRRSFIGTLAGGLLAAPLAAEGQAGKVHRIGLLRVGPPPPTFIEPFREGLRELLGEAPVLILACVGTDGAKPMLTTGASIYPATQNIMLAAVGLPAPCGILHIQPPQPATARGERTQEPLTLSFEAGASQYLKARGPAVNRPSVS